MKFHFHSLLNKNFFKFLKALQSAAKSRDWKKRKKFDFIINCRLVFAHMISFLAIISENHVMMTVILSHVHKLSPSLSPSTTTRYSFRVSIHFHCYFFMSFIIARNSFHVVVVVVYLSCSSSYIHSQFHYLSSVSDDGIKRSYINLNSLCSHFKLISWFNSD